MATEQRWIDGHLDLAYLAVNGRDVTQPLDDGVDACISLPALREAGVDIVFATIFTELNHSGTATPEAQVYARGDTEAARLAGIRQLEVYEHLEQAGELSIIRRRRDLESLTASPGIVILMEGADPIRDSDDAAWWHARGVRIVGLTWAMGSRYAGGNATGGGLSPAGRALVAALDQLGIVHDASHLSEPAFDDLLSVARGRIIASHSNARAIDHTYGERNLSDAQIRAIADRNGVIGINLFTKFLATNRRADVHDVVRHIEHIAAICGAQTGIGLGSDMDGGFPASKLADGVDQPARLGAITDALHAAGWSEHETDSLAHGAWRRMLNEVLPD